MEPTLSKQPKHQISESNPTPEQHVFEVREVTHRPLTLMIHSSSGHEVKVCEEWIDGWRSRGYETEHERGNRKGQNAIAKAKADQAKEDAAKAASEAGSTAPSIETPAPAAPKPKRAPRTSKPKAK